MMGPVLKEGMRGAPRFAERIVDTEVVDVATGTGSLAFVPDKPIEVCFRS